MKMPGRAVLRVWLCWVTIRMSIAAQPRVFIGSSSEALVIARRVQQELNKRANATLWQDAFRPGQVLLTNLVGLVNTYDFGVFVFSPDDILVNRKNRERTVRDNVLFEIGIFMGGLGIDRTFILVVERRGQRSARVPTDLEGLIMARISASMTDNVLSHSLREIRAAMNALGPLVRSMHDEIRALRSEIDERELDVGGRTYYLADLLCEMAKSRPSPWTIRSLPRPAFDVLTAKRGTWVTNEVYWWSIVLGILRFKDIDTFTSGEGWHWTHSVEYVDWSGRGVALLNDLRRR